MDIEIITSRDLAENRGWPHPRRRAQSATRTEQHPAQLHASGSDGARRAPVMLEASAREVVALNRTELDCRTCCAPASACGDCVMGVLLQVDGPALTDAEVLTPDEQRAVAALSSGGLLPPLRHRSAS